MHRTVVQPALEIKDKTKKECATASFFDWRTKKPAAARDKSLNFVAPSLDANEHAVDKTLTPVNIENKPNWAKVNDEVANNQATKDPVMSTTFLSHRSIKTFNPKDINPIFDKSEDANDINDKDWEGLENNNDNGTTQDSNDQAQQAEPNSLSSSFFIFSSFLFSSSLSPVFS